MALLLFDQAALDKQIAAVAPSIPEGHTSALIGTVDDQGVQAVISIERETAHGRFTAAGVLRHTWTGDNQVGARVIWSF